MTCTSYYVLFNKKIFGLYCLIIYYLTYRCVVSFKNKFKESRLIGSGVNGCPLTSLGLVKMF